MYQPKLSFYIITTIWATNAAPVFVEMMEDLTTIFKKNTDTITDNHTEVIIYDLVLCELVLWHYCSTLKLYVMYWIHTSAHLSWKMIIIFLWEWFSRIEYLQQG